LGGGEGKLAQDGVQEADGFGVGAEHFAGEDLARCQTDVVGAEAGAGEGEEEGGEGDG